MDKNVELDHLRQAERHIAQARQRIAAQEELIASGRVAGQELEDAVTMLRSMHRTLEEFERHRQAIVALVQDLSGGRI